MDTLIQDLALIFKAENPQLFKIWENKCNGLPTGYRVGHPYEGQYANYFEVFNKGFVSELLSEFFTYNFYYNYFSYHYETSVDLIQFVDDEDKLFLKLKEVKTVLTSIALLQSHICIIANDLGFKSTEFMFMNKQEVLGCNIQEHVNNDFLISIYDASLFSLGVKGNCGFHISRVGKSDLPFTFDPELKLNSNIFYTSKPEHIINMAFVLPKGIYLVANIPDSPVNTAFYFIFITDNETFIVENNKHSLRNQMYRNNSRGEDGEELWLGQRYEHVHLPFNEIITKIDTTKNESTEITDVGGHGFTKIMTIDECFYTQIVWIQRFIDRCVSQLQDFKFEIPQAVSIKFLDTTSLINNEVCNLPAVYSNSLPSVTSMIKAWDPKELNISETDYNNTVKTLVNVSKEVITDFSGIPNGLLSMNYLSDILTYHNRTFQVGHVQAELDYSWTHNRTSVFKKIKSFVKTKLDTVCKNSDKLRDIEKQFLIRKRLVTNTSAPHLWDSDKDEFCVDVSVKSRRCLCCNNAFVHSSTRLVFIDFEIFKEFFELTDNEVKKLPKELVNYLNIDRLSYRGNRLLSDLDPIYEVNNPWWFKTGCSTEVRFLWIEIDICGTCKRKSFRSNHGKL